MVSTFAVKDLVKQICAACAHHYMMADNKIKHGISL